MAVKKKVSKAAKKVMKKATKAAGKAKKAAGKAKKVVKKIAKGSARPGKGIKAAVAKRKAKKAGKGKPKGKAKMAAVAAAAGKKKAPGMYGGKTGEESAKTKKEVKKIKDSARKDYEGTGMYSEKAPGMYSGKKGAHMMDQPMMADSDRLEGAGSEGDPGLGRMSMGASMSSMSKHMKGGPLMSKYKVGTGGKKLR
jgi:hypothetical protein